MTPLDRAAFHGYCEIVELLLAADSNPPLEQANDFGGKPLASCLFSKINGWIKDSDYPGTVRALLKAGARYREDWLPYPDEEIESLLKQYPDSAFKKSN